MTMLYVGLALFALVHLVPAVGTDLRSSLIARLGEGGYKGIFSLLLVASLALMVFGWRGAQPEFVYAPLSALHLPALALMVVAFYLFIVSGRPSRIKRLLRHPQLTGVALWGIAHLLINGDIRSLVLFGGMSLWAVLEILAINRRDGEWQKPEPPAMSVEIAAAAVAAVVVVVLIFVHPGIAGVPVR